MSTNTVALRDTPVTPFVMDNPVFDVEQFRNMVAVAELMAQAKLVPEHLQGKPADCFLVVEQARRWNMSPFAVAQETYSVKQKLLFGGKLVTAVVNSRAPIKAPLAFSFKGEGDQCVVTASATFRGEDEPRIYSIKIFDAKAVAGNSNLWKTDPKQQACYFAARFWARRHCPEVILGVWSEDEIVDGPARDVTPPEQERANAETRRLAMEQIEAVEVVTVYGETQHVMPGELMGWISTQAAEPVTDEALEDWINANDSEIELIADTARSVIAERKAKTVKPTGNGRKPLVMLDAEGQPAVEYEDATAWIGALEAADDPTVNANFEVLTKIATSAKATPELRARAEALRERVTTQEDML